MMTHNGTNKTLILSGATEFNAVDLYSECKRWEVDNMEYASPFDADGKVLLGGSVYTDMIFKLSNGWKLTTEGYLAGTPITVNGTLVTDDGSTRIVEGDSPVTWQFSGATAGIVVATGSGVTAQDKIDIISGVLQSEIMSQIAEDTELVKKIEAGKWKIESNQLKVYDDDDTTVLLTFNLKDGAGVPSSTNVLQRIPV